MVSLDEVAGPVDPSRPGQIQMLHQDAVEGGAYSSKRSACLAPFHRRLSSAKNPFLLLLLPSKLARSFF